MSEDEFDAPDFFDDDLWGDGYCSRCDGKGWVLVCVDDICHGLGYCMHGDGMMDCPECENEWDVSEFPADFDFTALEGR